MSEKFFEQIKQRDRSKSLIPKLPSRISRAFSKIKKPQRQLSMHEEQNKLSPDTSFDTPKFSPKQNKSIFPVNYKNLKDKFQAQRKEKPRPSSTQKNIFELTAANTFDSPEIQLRLDTDGNAHDVVCKRTSFNKNRLSRTSSKESEPHISQPLILKPFFQEDIYSKRASFVPLSSDVITITAPKCDILSKEEQDLLCNAGQNSQITRKRRNTQTDLKKPENKQNTYNPVYESVRVVKDLMNTSDSQKSNYAKSIVNFSSFKVRNNENTKYTSENVLLRSSCANRLSVDEPSISSYKKKTSLNSKENKLNIHLLTNQQILHRPLSQCVSCGNNPYQETFRRISNSSSKRVSMDSLMTDKYRCLVLNNVAPSPTSST